jgi:hypothetical protein
MVIRRSYWVCETLNLRSHSEDVFPVSLSIDVVEESIGISQGAAGQALVVGLEVLVVGDWDKFLEI